MSCIDERELLGYIDGELRVGERERITVHLADCPRCRRRLAELQVNLERIAAGLDDMVPPTIPVLPLNSRAPLSRASSADVPGGRRNRRIRQWAPVGAAACIALVSAILSLTHHEQAPAAATYDEAELLAVYDDYQSPNDIWAGRELVISIRDSDGSLEEVLVTSRNGVTRLTPAESPVQSPVGPEAE